jgi:large repetitive protein
MRFRSVSFLIIAGFLLWVSAASAQKRVFSSINPNSVLLNKYADIFDPATGKITPVSNPMNKAREQHVAIRMASGKILIAGGYDNYYLRDAEIFDPADGTFTITQRVVTSTNVTQLMTTARSGAASVLMPNGDVLIIGGYNRNYLSSVDIYDPIKGTFTPLSAQMIVARQNPGAVLLNDGSILMVGGINDSGFIDYAERYDPINHVFNPVNGNLNNSREGHTTTLLSDGKVLVTGGCNNRLSSEIVCDNYLATAEIFDPATNLFTLTGSMTVARRGHTAVLLQNGKVLITGGTDGVNTLSSAEVYDPQTGTFTSTGIMGTPRSLHTASILPNGKVLIAGGQSDAPLASIEVYDPATGTFVTSAEACRLRDPSIVQLC